MYNGFTKHMLNAKISKKIKYMSEHTANFKKVTGEDLWIAGDHNHVNNVHIPF
jgi:hypothetical protein